MTDFFSNKDFAIKYVIKTNDIFFNIQRLVIEYYLYVPLHSIHRTLSVRKSKNWIVKHNKILPSHMPKILLTLLELQIVLQYFFICQ